MIETYYTVVRKEELPWWFGDIRIVVDIWGTKQSGNYRWSPIKFEDKFKKRGI